MATLHTVEEEVKKWYYLNQIVNITSGNRAYHANKNFITKIISRPAKMKLYRTMTLRRIDISTLSVNSYYLVHTD